MYPAIRCRRVVLSLFLCAIAGPTCASRLQVQIGRSYMDRYPASSVFVERLSPLRRIGDSRFTWSPDLSLGWIDGRDIPRLSHDRYDTRKTVWLVAAGARLHYGDAGAWYAPLFFSLQPAVASGRTQALSTPLEFISTIGWQGRRFSVQIRHISNANLHGPNRGETMALLGLGFEL